MPTHIPNDIPTALVTGASKGLGATIAQFLAGAGYNLILTARGEASLIESAHTLDSYGVKIMVLAGDVADANHRRKLAQAVESFGRLDVLVNNASELGPSPLPTLADYPLDKLAEVFNVNVIAPVALVQTALPLLKTSSGLVINISSDAAVGGYETWGGYGASKAALDLISLTLANELKDSGVAVVSVDPGDLRTDMHQAAYLGQDISDRPTPDVTLPFWAWLLGQDRAAVTGHRFSAQSDKWEVAS